jgi:hypothetical protein
VGDAAVGITVDDLVIAQGAGIGHSTARSFTHAVVVEAVLVGTRIQGRIGKLVVDAGGGRDRSASDM